ncbi:MAG: hypothetical protein AAF531_19310 [Actinomycetota bacterium]
MEPRTSFVGRDRELAVVERQVRATRLVTLTGAGGIGKTRLALRVSEILREDAIDGVVVVELARLPPDAAVEVVEERVVAALGSSTVEAVREWARHATALIVFDNCEHVVEAAAAVVESLVADAPELRVLATSRVPFGLPDEYVLVLEPLHQPAAVQLLRERATAAGATMPPGADADLERLANRLDGLPLALELAATRLRSLSPAEVEQGIANSARLLQQERTTFGRHRSMDEAVLWSYELLDPELQRFFRGLAVFPSRFGLDDVVETLGDGERSRTEVADLLDRLVARSLVSVVSVGHRRYRLLEPVRQPALEWLEASGEADEVEQRWISRLVTVANDIIIRGLTGAWTDEVMDMVFDVSADLRAAVRRCMEIDDGPDRAFTLYIPSWAVVHHREVMPVAQVGDELLQRWPEPGAQWWPEVAAIAATAQLGTGDLDRVDTLVDAVLAAQTEPSVATVVALRAKALALAVGGSFDEGYETATEASRLAGELGLDAFRVELDSHRGGILTQQGLRSDAERVLLQALEESRAGGSILVELATLHLLADHHVDENAERCRAYLVAIDERLPPDSTVDTSWARRFTAAQLAIHEGDATAAARHLEDGLRLALVAGDQRDVWRAIRIVGLAAALVGDRLEPAARLLAAADAEPSTPTPGEVGRERYEQAMALVGPLAAEPAADPLALAYDLIGIMKSKPVGQATPDDVTAVAARPRLQLNDRGATVAWGGTTVELRAMKGLRDLARLIEVPGREIHVLELMGASVAESDLGPVLDGQARRQYEDRLRELQAEIHEAEDANDLGRLESTQDEFDAVVAALGEGLGLGGKDRRPGATAEKARQAVSWRLRAAIKRMESVLPDCGRHLRHSIQTGAFCRYEPETDPGWVVEEI